jgi:hypothetical protein
VSHASEDRATLIEVCEKYLRHGLVERQPQKIPLAINVVRIERAAKAVEGRDALLSALSSKGEVEDVLNVRWIVDGDQVVALFEVRVTFSPEPVFAMDRFTVRDGEIVEIEAIYQTPAAAHASVRDQSRTV